MCLTIMRFIKFFVPNNSKKGKGNEIISKDFPETKGIELK